MNEQQIALFGSKKSDNWGTPRWLYEQLDQEFNFYFDPCPLNSEVDGLNVEWKGNVFCNPPYSKVEKFLQKAHQELKNGNAKIIVFLVFANTDTAWFHNYIYHKAELRFIKGRIKFVGEAQHGAMRPSMLAIFRKGAQ